MSSSDGGQPCQSDTDSSVEESDFDTMPDIESDKNIIRTKVPLPGRTLGKGRMFNKYTFSKGLSFLYFFPSRETIFP